MSKDTNKYLKTMSLLSEQRDFTHLSKVDPSIVQMEKETRDYIIMAIHEGHDRTGILKDLVTVDTKPDAIKSFERIIEEVARLPIETVKSEIARILAEQDDDMEAYTALADMLVGDGMDAEDAVSFLEDIYKDEYVGEIVPLEEGGPGSGRRGKNFDHWRASYIEKHVNKHGYNSPGHIEAYTRAWALPKGHKGETTNKHMKAMKLLQSGRYSLSQIAKQTGLKVQQVYQNRARLARVEGGLGEYFGGDHEEGAKFKESMRDISNRRVAAATKGPNKNFGTKRRKTRIKELEKKAAAKYGHAEMRAESVEEDFDPELVEYVTALAESDLSDDEVNARLAELDESFGGKVNALYHKIMRGTRRMMGLQRKNVIKGLERRTVRHTLAASREDTKAAGFKAAASEARGKQAEHEKTATRFTNMASLNSKHPFRPKASLERKRASMAGEHSRQLQSMGTTATYKSAIHTVTAKNAANKAAKFKGMKRNLRTMKYENVEEAIEDLLSEGHSDEEIFDFVLENFDENFLDSWLDTLQEDHEDEAPLLTSNGLPEDAEMYTEGVLEEGWRPNFMGTNNEAENDGKKYKVIRFHKNNYRKVTIAKNLSRSEAISHCSHPETSSKTATGTTAKRYAKRNGEFFDGFDKQ